MENALIRNGQYNIGEICTRQQCVAGRGDRVALRFIPAHGEGTDYTFSELDAQSNRFANLLKELGFREGDVFFTFLPKLRVLKANYLGTDAGDISTLED